MALVGDRVGRLTVKEKVGKAKNGCLIWLCTCECGGTIEVQASSLNSGLTRSCGCLYKETRLTCKKTHGRSSTREYNSWTGMKQRCYYEGHDYFKDYGGRGIAVCDEWINSFEKFYEDMGECPRGMSIERKDPNGNYCKENCIWDTASNQGFNKNLRPNNTSGRTGVYFHKDSGKWAASITKDYISIHLGIFDTYEDAVHARVEAELKLYGKIKDK